MTAKTNFAIRTTDKTFKSNVNTLEALGYQIFPDTKKAAQRGDRISNRMDGWDALSPQDGGIARASFSSSHRFLFENISDFLEWHFTPEQTQEQLEIAKLEGKIKVMQDRIACLKEVS